MDDFKAGNALIIHGLADGDQIIFIAKAQDVNGDGLDDIVLSSYQRDLTYVIFGNANMLQVNEFDLKTLDGSNGFTIGTGYVDKSNWHLRYHESAYLDDDEFGDIVLPNNHEMNIIFGRKSFSGTGIYVPSAAAGSATTIQFADTQIIQKIHNTGDVNGDKIDDLIVAHSDRAYLI